MIGLNRRGAVPFVALDIINFATISLLQTPATSMGFYFTPVCRCRGWHVSVVGFNVTLAGWL